MTAPLAHPALLIIGFGGVEQVGYHLQEAARGMGIASLIVDSEHAFAGPRLGRAISWRLRGRRPPRLASFSELVVNRCRELQPAVLLCTGFAPVARTALQTIQGMGIETVNFLTDDPFSERRPVRWFIDALSAYDHVFSPRRANLQQLAETGCSDVTYLPFAYNPAVHYPVAPPSDHLEVQRLGSDVLFVGGADAERIPYFVELIEGGLDVSLYGRYWERHRATRTAARGPADADTIRKATACTKVAPCLVRRSNRDGHSMRTFELPAMRCCILAEDTTDHRAIFGTNPETVVYFDTPADLLTSAKALVADTDRRTRLAEAAWGRVVGDGNTYEDRLRAMLSRVATGSSMDVQDA